MPLTNPLPKTVANRDQGFLAKGIQSDTTTILVSPIFKYVDGVKVKQGFGSTAGYAEIVQGDRHETINVLSVSVDADFVTTLTVERGLNPNSTTPDDTEGTGIVFFKGAKVAMIADARYFQSLMSAESDNTLNGDNVFNGAVEFNNKQVNLPQLTTAQRDALTGTRDGSKIWNTTTSTEQRLEGSTWVDLEAGTNPIADESTLGRVEAATLAELDKATPIEYYVPANKVISEHDIYTSALLTGSTDAETNVNVWKIINDGSFRISIDGTAYNVDGLDFTGDADMDAVAANLQAGLRAETGSTETITWSSNKFIITSVSTDFNSAVSHTTTSTGTVGTDVSGAGGSNYMDCNTGDITYAELDAGANEGYIIKLDADGKISNDFFNTDSKFGNASDGSYILDGTTATVVGLFEKVDATNYKLLRDCQFLDLTVDTGINLSTNGYRLYVFNELAGDGTIHANGNAGSAGGDATHNSTPNVSTPGAGGAGGAGAYGSGGSYKACLAGGVGATGAVSTTTSTVAGNDSPSGTDTDKSLTGNDGAQGGKSGKGWYSDYDSTKGDAGLGGVATEITDFLTQSEIILEKALVVINRTTNFNMGAGASGGGGGPARNYHSAGAGGGGGGGEAGIVFVKAYKITGDIKIEAKGGDGGDGGDQISGNNGNTGGGGGGGNGGYAIIMYRQLTGTITDDVSGGSGGTKGAPSGSAGALTAAEDGNDGNDGISYILQF
jgi:hypothetical protein